MQNPEIATGAYKDCDRAVRPGVRVTTGRDQKATGCCEERDWAVRSGSTIATERFTTIRSRPIGPSRSQGLRLLLTEEGHVL
ncbi:hypothetical protein Taro_039156 [Colocasia esculenta]|uniref:Uncharacterized protein n=1 Tax=Colocasia esculenta TaxID=4460 RepID=A0A843W5K8_COLES|nr:hypothetical protein [Colocasia esculenta]